MELIMATDKDLDAVYDICYKGITVSYGKVYPQGAVDYFCEYHSRETIQEAIKRGEVYLAVEKGRVIGTVSLADNRIERFFVAPNEQRKGYGSLVLSMCEERLFKDYATVNVEAALSSFNMYLHRGYIFDEYILLPCNNGDFLAYMPMHKNRSNL